MHYPKENVFTLIWVSSWIKHITTYIPTLSLMFFLLRLYLHCSFQLSFYIVGTYLWFTYINTECTPKRELFMRCWASYNNEFLNGKVGPSLGNWKLLIALTKILDMYTAIYILLNELEYLRSKHTTNSRSKQSNWCWMPYIIWFPWTDYLTTHALSKREHWTALN